MDAAVGRNLIDSESGAMRGKGYLILDRDTKYTDQFRRLIRGSGTNVIRLPPRSPNLNAICERVIGTARRECLDWMIPVSESHLRAILKCWVTHYNRGRPHSSLGPGVPGPPPERAVVPRSKVRHRLAANALILARSVLGGLHHEYWIVTSPAGA